MVAKVVSAGTSAVCAAAFAFSACASSGDNELAQPTSSSADRPTAYQMCQSAAGRDEAVVAAHLTTVTEVRTRRGGPPPGISPAEKPWAHLPGEAAAAWCTFQSGSRYVVAATTVGSRRAVFMISGTMFDPGSQGPAIP
jgi:hypothetical protein